MNDSVAQCRRIAFALGFFGALLLVGAQSCSRQAAPRKLEANPAHMQLLGPDANTKLWGIGGSVANSNPNAWVAVRNGNDVLYVYGSNKFTFPTTYVNNTAYDVSIAGTDPSLQCNISNNTGSISNAPVNGVAVTCSTAIAPLFINGFERFDRAPDWSNTIDTSWGGGNLNNVVGYCCGMSSAQAMTTANESAHTGVGSLVFSGWGLGNPNTQQAYLKTFDLSTLNLLGAAWLTYWIFPQSGASDFAGAVNGNQSVYAALDLTLANGTAIHMLPQVQDQFGNLANPASQGNLVLDTWNFVAFDLGPVSNEQFMNLSIGWQGALPGGYRGYIDDVIIDYTLPPERLGISTSWENFQIQPSWRNTVDVSIAGGNAINVTGLCCGAPGPQAFVSSEMGYTGSHSLVYAGQATGAALTYAYMQVLDLTHSNIVLNGLSQLTYRVYPQSAATFFGVSGAYSADVAVDIIFSDGSSLRESGLTDIYGNGVTPSEQSASLMLDTWNLVTIPLGTLAGRVPVRIDVGWDVAGAYGGYRGLIDDIAISSATPGSQARSASLVRIVLAPVASFVMTGGVQLLATGVYSDGTQLALAGNVTYTSDHPAVASVDANGYVTRLANGHANITASYSGVTSPPYVVTVGPPTYQLGGTVSGLSGANRVILLQGRDDISVGNGSFNFPTPVAQGAAYSTSLTWPSNGRCAFVSNSNVGVMPNANTMTIVVQCVVNANATMVYNFNNTVQASYAYDGSTIGMGLMQAYLLPLYTNSGDSTSANFAAGTTTAMAWDSGGFMRLTPATSTTFHTFFSGFELLDPPMTWNNTVDPAYGTNNITGVCCGLTYPESTNGGDPWSGAQSMMYSGSSTSASGTYAYSEIFNLQNQNIIIDANSYLSYYIFPQDSSYHGYPSGSNSAYVALDLIFTDGTDTASATIYDANNVALQPNAQGSGGYVLLQTWNHVQANLGSLSGKQVARVDLKWQGIGLTGGYRGYIDDILLSAATDKAQTNTAALDGSWAPHASNIIGYWNFDGAGTIANNTNIASGFGSAITLTASNNNGAGMAYTTGHLNQAVFLDGIDDYFTINSNGFPNSTAMSFSGWVLPVQSNTYTCPRVYEIGADYYDRHGMYLTCPGYVGTFYTVVTGGTNHLTSPTTEQPYGAWYHVAVTLDAVGNANVYLNGTLFSTATGLPAFSSLSGDINFLGWSLQYDNHTEAFFDEFAFWNVALSQNDVETIYQRQSAAVSGTFTSRVVSVPYAGAAAVGLGWESTLPSGKELPSNGLSETTGAYAGLHSSTLNANLVTLWHLDEAALGTVAGGDFYDDSGLGNVGVTWANQGTYPMPNVVGTLSRAVFNPGNYGLDTGFIGATAFNSPEPFTISAWFQTISNGWIVGLGDNATGYSANRDRFIFMDVSGYLNFTLYNGSVQVLKSTQPYNDGRWHHVVAGVSSAGSFLYVDGNLQASNAGVTYGQSFTGWWHVACDSGDGWGIAYGAYCFYGRVDEIAIWERGLSAGEVSDLYRRGANRLKYQVKICQTGNCSDIPTWMGPDTTSQTWFSELNNRPGLSGLPGPAQLQFATVAPGIPVNANYPYAQYRAVVESDDMNQSCVYSGMPAACSPEVNSTSFFRINYATTGPSIADNSAIPYYKWTGFAQSIGNEGCASPPGFTLSPDGVSWYWYNGSGWAASNSTLAQSTTAAMLTGSVLQSFSGTYGQGDTYFKAYLPSDGVHTCTLQNVTVNVVQ